jgi:3-isopropylmalate/(R)-2-methylmalate dehydratase small subunit
MKSFVRETGAVIPMKRANIDTDQIIPKQFLKRIERTGYGPYLFNDWRYDEDGNERPKFILNQAEYRDGKILLAGRNFGCGSSREHAVWALDNFGIRAVIAPSFADIFYSNATKGGLLPVVLPEDAVDTLASRAEEEPGVKATIDLETQTVTLGELNYKFAIDAFTRQCILNGLDDIGLTLEHARKIVAFEERRPAWMPDLRRGQDSAC